MRLQVKVIDVGIISRSMRTGSSEFRRRGGSGMSQLWGAGGDLISSQL